MHFAIHVWCDFVRGLTPKDVAVQMQQHLATGCDKCNRTARVMQKFATLTGSGETHVPPFIVRKATAIFPGRQRDSAARTVARIVYDSFAAPLPAGVRSRSQMHRQAMFEAGDVLVDVTLQRTAEGSFLIMGQVADRMTPARLSSRVALHLSSDQDRRSVRPNRFGEFQTVYHAGSNVTLEITSRERTIEVPLFQISEPFEEDTQPDPLDLGSTKTRIN